MNFMQHTSRADISQSLAHIAPLVRDYDEAIAWFTGVLGFTLLADQYQPEQHKRWVLVAPAGTVENGATSSWPAPQNRSRSFLFSEAGG
jgi:catechol 2,3-dioxygenase-like lactoylglutathione lyase family enzyme